MFHELLKINKDNCSLIIVPNDLKCLMDADNYYVLLYDLRNISELLEELWQYE